MGLFSQIKEDFTSVYNNDPAIHSRLELFFNYPGVWAIAWYRIANRLHQNNWKRFARIIMGINQIITNIDIHPAATIGNRVFIDHGTGVVIGETTRIGDRVRLYQGVTLGALSLPRDAGDRYRDIKRHPTIEDDVIIYSNATILGEKAIIGARSVIGGNVWITDRVPPDTKVLLKQQELLYVENNS